MKRSSINAAIRNAEDTIARFGWALPDFAGWRPEDHAAHPERSQWLCERQIGWDVTDFGFDEFERRGLTLFCVRNGADGEGERPYAEKLLFVGVDQLTPYHAHRRKLEDIIVRGGGTLVVEFTKEGMVEPVTGEPVRETVFVDGREHPAFQGPLRLKAGQSITIPRGLQHRFWGEGEPVFVAEVSECNDDRGDNYFLEPQKRFSEIDEDEPVYRSLWNEALAT